MIFTWRVLLWIVLSIACYLIEFYWLMALFLVLMHEEAYHK